MSAMRKLWNTESTNLPQHLIRPFIQAVEKSSSRLRDANACDKCKVYNGLFMVQDSFNICAWGCLHIHDRQMIDLIPLLSLF